MNNNINPKINVLIFSKNRACQLTACIKSFFYHFEQSKDAKINVLYKTTSDFFEKGYEKAKSKLSHISNINWYSEKDFSTQSKQLINAFDAPFTMFLVDDIIFTNNISLDDAQFKFLGMVGVLSVSLRLHDGVTKCYATDQKTRVPSFIKKCIWNWHQCEGDWGYPMSVDGNVYRTYLVKQFINNLNFTNPNNLEASLDSIKGIENMPSYLCCYPEAPRLINIPVNRVQNVFKNRFAKGFTADELNEMFLNEKEIDIKQYINIKPETVHVPIELKFTEK